MEQQRHKDVQMRHPQRIYTDKKETSTPIVSIEVEFLSCSKEAKENRYMVVSNIPGAFHHADMNDNVQMLPEGNIAETITKLDPKIYRKQIWYNKHEKPILYA